MAEITEYTDTQANMMKEMVRNDNGFHTSFSISDMPFMEMQRVDGDGMTITDASSTVSLVTDGGTARVDLRHSDERKCWFFTFSDGSEEIKGIVHFNTVYNAKGIVAFAFMNDSNLDDDASITRFLPYSNFFVMRK